MFQLISTRLRSLDPTLLYCIDPDWTTIHWWKKIGVPKNDQNWRTRWQGTCTGVDAWQNPHLKSMGNTVSAHIYEIKVFRPYPVILYRLRLDHSIHWWKKIGVPRNDQNWRTRW